MKWSNNAYSGMDAFDRMDLAVRGWGCATLRVYTWERRVCSEKKMMEKR